MKTKLILRRISAIFMMAMEGTDKDSFYNFLLNYEAYSKIDFGLIGEIE